MEKKNNCNIFLKNLTKESDDDLEHIIQSVNPVHTVEQNSYIKKESNQYILYYHNRKYFFKFLSEQDNIQLVDKEILLDVKKRGDYSLLRTLKLAGSMNLVDPRVIIGRHKTFELSSVISYIEDGKEMIIDYGNNLIMSKSDYYRLFDMREINVISKYELYELYWYKLNINQESIGEGLFFTKEILKDLARNIPVFDNKYNKVGIHNANLCIWGDQSDEVFHDSIDRENRPYINIQQKLDSFTINPLDFPTYIKELNQFNCYQFISEEFGNFEFGLISNLIKQDKELLSGKRYGKCHKNVQKIMAILDVLGYDHHFVTSGKIAKNDQDSNFHSWVELELENKKTIVLDYNHNLMMEKDKYYKLYGVKMISRIESSKMRNLINFCVDNQLAFSERTINFLGQENRDDFKRNEQVLIKK